MKNLRFLSLIFATILLGFTLQAQPLAVTLNSPSTASFGLSLTPLLDWTVADGTGPYTSIVKIYSDVGLTNLVYSQNVGGAITHAVPPSTLAFNTRYYWIVEVTDAFPTTITSSTFTFTTLLAIPVLASPADAHISSTMTPTLSWIMDDSRDNVAFRLLVGTTSGLNVGAHLNLTTPVNPGSLSTTPLALLPATKYWWTINAIVDDAGADNNGETSQAFTERTFYTPLDVLTTPIQGVTGHTLEPTFAWDDVTWESDYELRISTAGGSQMDFDLGIIFSDVSIPANTTSVIYNENTVNEGPGAVYPFPLNPNTTYYWQLVARDGSLRIPSPIWHFTTYPQVTVSQHNPANGDIVYLNNVQFSYGINQASAGLQFKLQVKAANVAPVKTDWLTSNYVGTTPNLFQSVNLLGGLKYYWRVVLLNSSNQVMAYSPTSYFTTSGGATVPYPSWPTGGAKVYTNAPQLYWYTAGYSPDITFDVQVKLDTNLVPVAYSATNINNIYHQISTNLLPGTFYYWSVRSVYKRGTPDEQISNWSAFHSFQTWGSGTLVIPTPSYPTDNLDIYTTTPYLYWWLGQDGTGLRYDIQFGTDPTLTTNTQIENITTQFYQLSGLAPGTTYYWRVRSDNTVNESAFSAIASFNVVGGVANSYPVLNWPIGNPTVYTTLPSLSWYLEGSSLGITGYVVRYKIGTNSSNWDMDYTGTFNVVGSGNTFYNFVLPFSEGQVVYWAVAATNGITLSSWASDYFTIYSGATPGEPVISWPLGNALIYTVDPQLNWWVNGSTSGIVGYQVVYSYSDVFAPAATTTAYSTSTSLNVTGLVEGATYYWKVRAHFGGISYGAFSATESFTVNPGSFAPVTPIVGGPDNIMISTTSPVLSWVLPTAIAEGTKYELEFADNQNFTNSTVFTDLTVARKTMEGLSENKSYFWRVRTKNSDGNYSFYSTLGNFRVIDGTTDIKDISQVPAEFALGQNYPNPFNPSTKISFALPADMNVKLTVYNTLGEQVAELVNGAMTAGTYAVDFNAAALPSGIYFYRIEAGANVAVRKMMLLK